MIKKKVSVIVPAYNSEKYVKRCIESIQKQTYKDLQIILIDDGSTDNTLQIFNEIASNDKRICVFSNKNQGVAATRNFGLLNAKGEYITFVDSDDYINKRAIELLVNSLVEKKADMAICNSVLIDVNGDPQLRDSRNYKKSFLNSNVWHEKEFWDHLYNGFWGECTVPWGKLYKTSLFNNLRYPNGKTNEDDYIIYDLIHRCGGISVISDKLYYHMDRINSITNSNSGVGKQFLDGIDAILIRTKKALLNNQNYLVKYSLRAVPTLMVIQFRYRDSKKYKKLKENYKKLFKEANSKGYINGRERISYFSFYYFQSLYNFIYKVYRKL